HAAGPERVQQECTRRTLRWRQSPRFLDKLRQPKLAPAHKWMIGARGNHEWIIVQRLEAHLIVCERTIAILSRNQEIDLPLSEMLIKQLGLRDRQMESHARIAMRQPIDDRCDKARRQRGCASDPHLAGRWVG